MKCAARLGRLCFFFFLKICIYVFILGCAGFSLLHGLSLVSVRGDHFPVMGCRLLLAVASLVTEHGL